jgi:DNA-binding CsgD family transcriptional regulator
MRSIMRTSPVPSSGTVVIEEADLLTGGAIDLLQRLVLDGIPVLILREDADPSFEPARRAGVAQAVTVLVAADRSVVPTVMAEPRTDREHAVMRLAVRGATARVIADRLGIGVRTVETHLDHVYRKTGVHSRAELVDVLARRPTAPAPV